MSFGKLTPRAVRWAPLGAPGLEHLALTPMDWGTIAEGIVVGEADGTGYGLVYGLAMDEQWRTRRLDIRSAGAGQVVIESEGDGHWRDGEGKALPHLDGAVDVDIAATPFTNTLPIRRLNLRENETAELRMVYIPMPDLAPIIDEQRYTCLESGHRYLYEAMDGSFSAEIEVDEDGLVLDYPGLFRRLLG
ncbi:putative glycolipid-binding domain-containing protein [Lutibaculum baratangense]|uniref:Uncharacterized protein n=1 Tax=Lutibaculum baratangense AMV1 TaxID=631454 RepID=V4R0N8_9HYPH|nr:putative glycolipid-binding domain-containing protein [Lutibaculum baratangense]ESR25557.1 protein of unknown function DUF1089 [Lutibaculum baratangense AMV1]